MVEIYGISFTWKELLTMVVLVGIVLFIAYKTSPYSDASIRAKGRALIKKHYDDTFEE